MTNRRHRVIRHCWPGLARIKRTLEELGASVLQHKAQTAHLRRLALRNVLHQATVTTTRIRFDRLYSLPLTRTLLPLLLALLRSFPPASCTDTAHLLQELSEWPVGHPESLHFVSFADPNE